jgi:hypothetical protein
LQLPIAGNVSAFGDAGLVLSYVQLLFVSNKNCLVVSPHEELMKAKEKAQQSFVSAALELLNTDSFEFGSFSIILEAPNPKNPKQKREIKQK